MVLSCLVLTVSGGFAKQTRERSREVIGYLTRLEQGFFGTRDLNSARRPLKRDLERGEHLYLVISTVGESTAWGRVMDKELMGKDDTNHSIVNEQYPEIRLDNLKLAGLTYSPKGKRVRYDNRFYVEGLRFAKELELRLEIRKGSQVIDSDV
ncbi:MAG: hypothetical protein D6820_07620, partial [Lentisphaerae bacterium]